jgi:hypothetical protein
MNPVELTSLHAVARTGCGLRVDFLRQADRVAHRISLVADERPWPLLDSCEGSPLDTWPASPALQEVQCQAQPAAGRVALAVGMAGTSHWSLSVTAAEDPPALLFEVACRVRAQPSWLGSRYRAANTACWTQLPAAAECRLAGMACRIEPSGSQRPDEVRITAAGADVAIAVLERAGPLPSTVRWQYALVLVPGLDSGEFGLLDRRA